MPRGGRRGFGRRIALTLAGLAVGATLVALGWLVLVYPETPGPGTGRVVEIEVARGASVASVARALADRGALASPRAWTLYASLRGARTRLRAGKLLVRDSMRPGELLRRLAAGYGPVQVRMTLPEGFDRFDVARELDHWGVTPRDAFLRATTDPSLLAELGIEAPSAEGYLFPDTYELDAPTDSATVVRLLVENARRRMQGSLARGAGALHELERELGWGIQEIVTLASIVEKEARVDEERPLIAGVFLNRLRSPAFEPRRLQADPTAAYGCRAEPGLASCRSFDGRRAAPAMLLGADNPYNTYRHEGLPPGPIANPGLASIEAVLTPEKHEYFYFVAAGGGRHSFSATLDDHRAAVQRLRNGAGR